MKVKKLEMKLKLNKVTISRLDNLQLENALAGQCPPPTSPGGNESCNGETGCSLVECNPDTMESTAPC